MYCIKHFCDAGLTLTSSEFADSTILTIAHRLRTVIDYNRVSISFPWHDKYWTGPDAVVGDAS